ncbi:MAG: threonine--tRNA ligase [Acidimicrobiia bacterium]
MRIARGLYGAVWTGTADGGRQTADAHPCTGALVAHYYPGSELMAIQVTFPDGSTQEFAEGSTGRQVAGSIGPRLAQAAVAVELDGRMLDLDRPLPGDGAFVVVTDTSDEGRRVLRHSAAHVLAQAVLSLYEGTKFAIGPPVADGFYYDFDIGRPFTPDDLERIEARMGEIIEADQPFRREEVSRAEALELFADQPFKLEIIESVEESEGAGGEDVTLYRNEEFVDLCRGPHVPSTGRLVAVKLLRTAGAYWRGDENRPQLQRIYGTAWEDRKALDTYLHRLEEAGRRDHRRLGVELDLFSFPAQLGSGLAVWHPKGGLVRTIMEDYSRRTHLAHGYEIVSTPHLARSSLWQTSGHLDFFAENMYPAMEIDEGDEYIIKPMNCPFHILIFRSRGRSYRELPLRLFELGTVYRYERSGVVHGLLRARGFTQDDSHIFCSEEQLAGELGNLLDFTLMVLRDFGFTEFEADLSTRPGKFVGRAALWDRATAALHEALDKEALEYQVAEGEGAFYGPKIDINVRDAIGRRWQVTTLQVDFAQPENFDLEFTTRENTRERPVMIHRALFGSVERFFGVLLEHYAGVLPAWLSPVQVAVVPVADRHRGYAEHVAETLRSRGLRVEIDDADDTVGEKIRRAMVAHHPAVLVAGDEDVDADTVGVRIRGRDEERRGVSVVEAARELVEFCKAPG